MADQSNIEWTDATWNPVTGCTKVSPGCDNCYAIRDGARLQHLPAYTGTIADGDWTGKINLVEDRLDQPLRWRKPRRVFVNSMSDLFHPDVPVEFIARVWATMHLAKAHQFQILTKRPQRMQSILTDPRWEDLVEDQVHLIDPGEHIDWERREYSEIGEAGWLPNVWLGTSIESDKYTFRANILRRTPAAVRFLSLEPLLGPVPSLLLPAIDWVIAGGESGSKARPMHPDWVRDIRDRCIESVVPFLFKQWGEWVPPFQSFVDGFTETADNTRTLWPDGDERAGGSLFSEDTTDRRVVVRRVGRKNAGRSIDTRTWDEFPEVVS